MSASHVAQPSISLKLDHTSTTIEVESYVNTIKKEIAGLIRTLVSGKKSSTNFKEICVSYSKSIKQEFSAFPALRDSAEIKALIASLNPVAIANSFIEQMIALPPSRSSAETFFNLYNDINSYILESQNLNDESVRILLGIVNQELGLQRCRWQTSWDFALGNFKLAMKSPNHLEHGKQISTSLSELATIQGFPEKTGLGSYCMLALFFDYVGQADDARKILFHILKTVHLIAIPDELKDRALTMVMKPIYHYQRDEAKAEPYHNADTKEELLQLIMHAFQLDENRNKLIQNILWQALIPTTFLGSYFYHHRGYFRAPSVTNSSTKPYTIAQELTKILQQSNASEAIYMDNETRNAVNSEFTDNKKFRDGLRDNFPLLYNQLKHYIGYEDSSIREDHSRHFKKPKLGKMKDLESSQSLLEATSPKPM